jgi:ComF family protein
LCAACTAPIPFPVISVDDDIVAGCFYQDEPIKSLIWHVKFKRRNDALDVLAPHIQSAFRKSLKRCNIPHTATIALIPIPLWHARQRERGFNQSEVIASLIAEGHAQARLFPEILVRTRATDPQSKTLSKQERKSNIKNCFRVVSPLPPNHAIILIDDIVTTGATMREAMRMLKKAGAKHVYGFALAH